ncbi:MAG: thrombospondin type 3 repeat-containing protein, partial [Nitrosarchaeum sp.]|nr:thrombospondin type 3 repeat-containing protein [Nitrosarchaeum sp.]
MKKYSILGLLLLIIFMGVFQGNAYGSQINDIDNDGVPNSIDHCPHLQEDYDPQFGNNVDGCPADFIPWHDSDFDAIPDHIDNCPAVKETYNKIQDDDGCPDSLSYSGKAIPDTDNDGIADFLDTCPTQSETFNGLDDKDGCPDKSIVTNDTDRDG